MADDVTLTGATGTYVTATDEIGGKHHQRVKVGFGPDGTATDVSAANPLPVAIQGALGSVSVSNFPATQPVSGTFWQATQPISGTVSVSNFPVSQPVTGTFWQATQPVSIAAPVSVTGTFFQATQPVSIAATVNVAGPLTDAQLRASPVVISPDATVEVAITGGVEALATETTLATLAGLVLYEDSPATTGHAGVAMLGMRQVSDTTSTDNDGDLTAFKMDEEGRAKVAAKPASYPLSSGNITAAAGTVAVNVSRISNVMAHVRPNPTMAGHNSTFEGSLNSTNGTDGNWFVIQAVRSNANTIETATGALAAAPVYGWELSVNGLNWFRVRATAHTSGTATWDIQPAAYATEPIPAAQASATQTVSVTGTSTVTPALPQPYTLNSLASTNAGVIKASTGQIHSAWFSNEGASAAYVKLYDLATSPTVGTSIPAITIAIPAMSTEALPAGMVGQRFGTGIAIATTNLMPQADATAVAAGQIKVKLTYI